MNCFNYPLDTKTLLRKKRGLKKEMFDSGRNFIHKKVAVLGGSTTNEIVDMLELFLLNYGIQADFYQSEYAQYWQDAMFSNPELDEFAPDVIYIHTGWRNIVDFPTTASSREDVDALLDGEFARLQAMWESIENKFGCTIIQNNFDRPNYRLMGNRDIWDYRGRSNYISRLNQRLYDYACTRSNFYINDLDYIAGAFGYEEWNDALNWNMYKYAMARNAIPYVAASVARIIKSIFGMNKKLLALDLDNTLWGGVVGDDGVEGIAVGPEVPSGQIYSEFQNYCKDLKQIGVILGVNSKNDEENALAGLNHPDGPLKPDDFVSIKANWNPKSENLFAMSQELSLGIDSFVFADDNPAEREIVQQQFPGVAVPVFDNVENYIRAIDREGYFEVTNFSSEDVKKTDLYKARSQAAAQMASFNDYGEYLDSLDMTAYINPFEKIYVQRIAQLTNKSNQFNLTTLRCSEDDIERYGQDPNYICYSGKLVDKFADNGIVTVVVGERVDSALHMRLWLMSCRVLKREMENAMMDTVVATAKTQGIDTIYGYYYPTAKNAMVKDFYEQFGFTLENEDEQGNRTWKLDVAAYKNGCSHIRIETK